MFNCFALLHGHTCIHCTSIVISSFICSYVYTYIYPCLLKPGIEESACFA